MPARKSQDAILGIEIENPVIVDVPEWNRRVLVRSLSTGIFTRLIARAFELGEAEGSDVRPVTATVELAADIVADTAHDPDSKRALFDDSGLAQLRAARGHGGVVLRLAMQAVEISNMGGGEIELEKKDSPTIQPDASGS